MSKTKSISVKTLKKQIDDFEYLTSKISIEQIQKSVKTLKEMFKLNIKTAIELYLICLKMQIQDFTDKSLLKALYERRCLL